MKARSTTARGTRCPRTPPTQARLSREDASDPPERKLVLPATRGRHPRSENLGENRSNREPARLAPHALPCFRWPRSSVAPHAGPRGGRVAPTIDLRVRAARRAGGRLAHVRHLSAAVRDAGAA